MYKIKAGIVTVKGEKYGCFVEIRTGFEKFIHLVNGDCYNECEVDDLIILEKVLSVDFEEMCEEIEEYYVK